MVQSAIIPLKLTRKGNGSLWFLLFCCLVSALGGFLFGYDLLVIGGAKDLIKVHFHLGPSSEGTLMSSAMIGAMLGCVFAGRAGDVFGRKKTLLTSSLLLLICSVGCALAWNIYSLTGFRLTGGIGVGIASMICPLYISEISPAHLRGRMVTLFQLAICAGIFSAVLVNTGLFSWHEQMVHSPHQGVVAKIVAQDVWRAMLGMETLPALLFILLCFVIPESPRWLLKKGRKSKALAILTRINGAEVADTELAAIEDTLSKESHCSIFELAGRTLRRPMLMALFLVAVSELSGITIMLGFGPEIIRNEQGGVLAHQDMIGMAVITFFLAICTLIAVWLMDKAGRRLLLFVGTAGCITGLVALAILLMRPAGASPPAGFIIPIGRLWGSGFVIAVSLKVAAVALFVSCFAFSMGPIKWVFMSEVFPSNISGRAVAVCSCAVWVADSFLNEVFPWISANFGLGTIAFGFAAVLVPQLFFVWKIMPETKGRSLEEIEMYWQKK